MNNTGSPCCLFFQSKWRYTSFRHITVRAYSTSKNEGFSTDFSDLPVFSDADKDKLDILKFIKGKAGIYMWTNKLNGKKYVVSSPSGGGTCKVKR